MDMSRKSHDDPKLRGGRDRCVPPELANSLGGKTTARSKAESEKWPAIDQQLSIAERDAQLRS